jgi:hypothetical protein
MKDTTAASSSSGFIVRGATTGLLGKAALGYLLAR